MEDLEIIDLFWKRDQQAVSAVCEKYAGYCRRIAGNILGSDEDTEECLNDTWFAAWENIPPERPEHLAAYLGRIARNAALKKVRDAGRAKRGGDCGTVPFDELEDHLLDGTNVEEQAEANELAAAVNRFLEKLKPEQRKIFVRRFWYGDSIDDLAVAFGATQSKIKMTLLRSKKALKDLLVAEGLLQ